MDPDPEAEQAASQLFKTALITIVFSTCHYEIKTTTYHPIKRSGPSPQSVSKPVALIKKKKKKTVYLTFDDGPNKGTRKVMHIAEEERVPVTLFIVGEHVFASQFQNETMDSLMESDMIEIANHSFTHAHNQYQKFYTHSDSVVCDFKRCADSLGLTNNIVRTPGRNIWRTQNVNSTDLKSTTGPADSLSNKGYTLVGWDLEWHYDNNLCLKNCADSIFKQIDSAFARGKTKNKDHLVLLAHDQVYADTDDSVQLRILVNKLKKSDYDLEFISKYPGIKN
jgi:hypothetical protein